MRRLLLILCTLGLLAAAPPLATKETSEIPLTAAERERIYGMNMVMREIPHPGKPGKAYEVVSLVRGTSAQALAVLRDYERYPEYMPNVAKTEIVAREGEATIVGYTLKLPLGKIKKYRLRIWTECEDDRFKVLWVKVPWAGLSESETIVDSDGSWTVEPSEKEGYLLVCHYVYTDPGKIPTGLGWIVDILTSKSLPGVVTALRNRIDSLYYAKTP